MERFTVTATFNGGLPQRPIFEGTESSLPYTSFPPKSHLRDLSFSSNTRPGEPKLPIEEHFGPQMDTEISIFDAQRYLNEGRDHMEKKQTSTMTVNLDRIPDGCDLSTASRLSSVSSVDGYRRNYRTSSLHTTPAASSNSHSGLLSIPPGSIAVSMRDLPLDKKRRGSSTKWIFRTRCPCAGKKSVQVVEKFSNPISPSHSNCSSNSSLNPKKQNSTSGEGALDRVPKELAAVDKASKEKAKVLDKNKIIDGRRELKSLAGNHLSSESGLVLLGSHSSLESNGRRIVSPGRSITAGGAFSFPVINPPAPGKLVSDCGKSAIQLEDPPRNSLKVFQPSDGTVGRKSTEHQRRLLMSFPGDMDHQSFTFPASPSQKTQATITDDDVASDTSSDLFEIESFSTQTTMYPLYRRRDSFDEFSSNDERRIVGNGNGILQFRRTLDETMIPSIVSTECYEPSDGSIDWSVTTAEGFDRGSVTNFSTVESEYENVRFIVQKESEKISNGGGSIGNIRKKGNGLLSCRCEKAVSVSPHPVKQEPDQRRHTGVGTLSIPVESCQIPAMSRLANLSSVHKAWASDKPPVVRSNSACMSHSFATQ